MKKLITLSVATFAVFSLAVAFALPNRANADMQFGGISSIVAGANNTYVVTTNNVNTAGVYLSIFSASVPPTLIAEYGPTTYTANSYTFMIDSRITPGSYKIAFRTDGHAYVTPYYNFMVCPAGQTLAGSQCVSAQNDTINVQTTTGGTVSGGGTVPDGSSVTVTATANQGYSFSNWTVGNTVVSSLVSYTFTATTSVTLTANFVPGLVVTDTSGICVPTDTSWRHILSVPTNTMVFWAIGINNAGVLPAGTTFGSVSIAWSGSENLTGTGYFIMKGSYMSSGTKTASVVITPTNRAPITVNCLPLTVGSTNTVLAPQYTVTAIAGAGGTVSGGDTGYYLYSPATVQASANSGYTFSNWTENGSVISTSTSYALTVTGNRTLTANFIVTPICPDGQMLSGTQCVIIPPKPVITITAAQSSVNLHDSTSITWSTTHATSCTASGGAPNWSGPIALAGSVSTGSLSGNARYILTCTGPNGANAAIATVVVRGAPVVSITASPTSVASGGTTTITWLSTGGATGCSASGGWTGDKAASSSEVVTIPSVSQLYTLNCSGPHGFGVGSVSVAVIPAPVISFKASPTLVSSSSYSTLQWTVSNASLCTASGDWTLGVATSSNLDTSVYSLNRYGWATSSVNSILSDVNSYMSNRTIRGTKRISNITSDKSFSLTCVGIGGTTVATTSVTVGVSGIKHGNRGGNGDGNGASGFDINSPGNNGGADAVGGVILSASPEAVAPGASIRLTWSASSTRAHSSDWVALYKVGAANTSYGAWTYVRSCITNCTFDVTAPSMAGSYQFRYLINGGYTSVGTSNTVVVSSAGANAVDRSTNSASAWDAIKSFFGL